MTRRRSVFHKPLVKAFCFLVQCLTVVSVGASTGALDGQVRDDDTGEPVGWVLLVVEGLDRACSADAAGHFTFRDLPPGEHVLLLGGRTRRPLLGGAGQGGGARGGGRGAPRRTSGCASGSASRGTWAQSTRPGTRRPAC